MKFFIFGFVVEIREQTDEEEVALLRKKFKGNERALAVKVLRKEGIFEIVDPDERFKKEVEVCAKYKLRWPIAE